MDQGTECRAPPQAPLSISSITPDSLSAEADEILGISRIFRDRLLEKVSPETATFANFIRPLMDNDNKNGCRLTTLGYLRARSSPDSSIRSASYAAQAKMNSPENSYHHRHDMAARVDAIYKRPVEDEIRCGRPIFPKLGVAKNSAGEGLCAVRTRLGGELRGRPLSSKGFVALLRRRITTSRLAEKWPREGDAFGPAAQE